MVEFGDVDFTTYFDSLSGSVSLGTNLTQTYTVPVGMALLITEICTSDGTNDGVVTFKIDNQSEVYGDKTIYLNSGSTDSGIEFPLPLKVQTDLKLTFASTSATARTVYTTIRGYLVSRKDVDNAFKLIVANHLK